MNEAEMVDVLRDAIELYEDESGESLDTSTFADVGLMTSNAGLVVRIGDSEFQITVVRSR